MNTMTFINAIKGQAQRDMKTHGILASLTIAQAILESGWGESGLTIRSNNLFGIKVSGSWQGQHTSMLTREVINGKEITVQAMFRKYDTWVDSIADHSKLLLNDRYKSIIGEMDYKQACIKVHQAGYATDPKYSVLLISLIEQYHLHQYDIKIIIERVLNNMDNKELQRILNRLGFRDDNGNSLVVDGLEGKLTKQALEKAKNFVSYLLK